MRVPGHVLVIASTKRVSVGQKRRRGYLHQATMIAIFKGLRLLSLCDRLLDLVSYVSRGHQVKVMIECSALSVPIDRLESEVRKG